ncbi:response regulator, partial [Pseudomonas sp. SID14000]
MRLLLVEDDPDVADPLVEGLSHEGYRVDVRYDGATALELLTDPASRVDLVVLDRDLPRVSGDVVC